MPPKTSARVTPKTHDRADMLYQFGQCASILRNLLYDHSALEEDEFVFLDKHFQILNMAYLHWKRKHKLNG